MGQKNKSIAHFCPAALASIQKQLHSFSKVTIIERLYKIFELHPIYIFTVYMYVYENDMCFFFEISVYSNISYYTLII